MTPKQKRIAYIDSQEPHTPQEQLVIEIFKKEVEDTFSEEDIKKWAESKREKLNASTREELEVINKNLKKGEEPLQMKDLVRGDRRPEYNNLHVIEMIAYMR